MAATGRGDPRAFAEFVMRHQGLAWAVACRFLGGPAEAEDVAQEAFLKVLQAAPRYEPRARFTTYLHGVTARLCIDRARKKRPVLAAELPERPDPSRSQEDAAIAGERGEAVRAALDRLQSSQRMAVILGHYQGLSYREIAAALETSEKAVEGLFARARAALEVSLAARWAGGAARGFSCSPV